MMPSFLTTSSSTNANRIGGPFTIYTLMNTFTQRKATLTLQDGTTYTGWHFGALRQLTGEVVFNTAMNGYTESLSDW